MSPVGSLGLRYYRELSFKRAPRGAQSEGGLMSDRVDFEVSCPNNHDQTVTFSREEFEEALTSDTLVFHCNTCDTNWPPSREEIGKFRKQLSKSQPSAGN